MVNDKRESLIHVAIITGKLVLITTLTAVLLAFINMLTEPVIAANDTAKKNAAVMELFPEATDVQPLGDTLGESYPENIHEVYAVYKAGALIGYCADAQAMGFGDNIGMMIGVNLNNTICGIKVLSIAETPGIGMAVAESDYLAGYAGLYYPVTFGHGTNTAEAISGATYSSRAILNGVNLVLGYLTTADLSSAGTADEPVTDADTTAETAAETEEVTDSE